MPQTPEIPQARWREDHYRFGWLGLLQSAPLPDVCEGVSVIVKTSLTARDSPWVHALPDDANVSQKISTVESVNGAIVLLDGLLMRSPEEVFRQYVREFHFPEYFGWNWAAFEECMTELEQFPAPSYPTVVSHSDKVLEDHAVDLRIYLSQLEVIGNSWAGAFGRGAEWGGGEVPFNTVLLCPVGGVSAVR